MVPIKKAREVLGKEYFEMNRCGQAQDVGIDPERLRDALATRWAFIFALDMDLHKEEALRVMEEFRSKRE